MIIVENLSLDEYKALLPEVHKRILRIAVEVKRICDKYGIKYFLIGGSLLGAVRHNGFIPWDDDMDIGFLRDDYERFLLICKTELGQDYSLLTTDEEKYGLPFAKIQLLNTVWLEKNAPQYACGNGIYVDIFPIDRIPDSVVERKTHEVLSLVYRYALLKKCGYNDSNKNETLEKKTIKAIVKGYSTIHSKSFLIKRLQRIATYYNKRDTQLYQNTGTAYKYGKEIFPEECLSGELPELVFEGMFFKCPKQPERILQMLYGDYLALPPENKRYNRHGILAVEFECKKK